MVEVEQGQEPVAVYATEQEWRVVAACIAACASQAQQFVEAEDSRALTGLWLRIHPEGEV